MSQSVVSGGAKIVDLCAYRELRAQKSLPGAPNGGIAALPLPGPMIFVAPFAYGWVWTGFGMMPCALMPAPADGRSNG